MDSYSPLLEDAPRILFHVRGLMDEGDCYLLEQLRDALRHENHELLAIAHHFPQRPANVPVLCVRNGLDAVRSVNLEHGWRAWLDAAAPLSEGYSAELLAREAAWNGLGDEAKRREAICFFERFYRAALAQAQPALLLLWNGWHPQEMILDRLCREAGVPVVYLERGLFPGTLHLDTEGILAASSVAKAPSWNWPEGTDPTPWHAAYTQRRDAYRTGGGTWWEQPKSAGPEAARKALAIPDGARVLLFAGQVDRDAQNLFFAPDHENNLTAFEAFCTSLNRDSRLFVLGKHHPKAETPAEAYREVLRESGVRGVWTDTHALNDCLALADRVAAVNSTVLFEGLLMGKPALAMGESLLSGKGIAYDFHETGAVPAWIAGDDAGERLTRWEDFAAWLLAEHLYATAPESEANGLRGLACMAEYLIAHTGAGAFPAAQPAFLEEVALWDEHCARFPEHEGLKEFLRGLHICARAVLGQRVPGLLAWLKGRADRAYASRERKRGRRTR